MGGMDDDELRRLGTDSIPMIDVYPDDTGATALSLILATGSREAAIEWLEKVVEELDRRASRRGER